MPLYVWFVVVAQSDEGNYPVYWNWMQHEWTRFQPTCCFMSKVAARDEATIFIDGSKSRTYTIDALVVSPFPANGV